MTFTACEEQKTFTCYLCDQPIDTMRGVDQHGVVIYKGDEWFALMPSMNHPRWIQCFHQNCGDRLAALKQALTKQIRERRSVNGKG